MNKYIYIFLVLIGLSTTNDLVAQRSRRTKRKQANKQTEQFAENKNIEVTAQFIKALGAKLAGSNKAISMFEDYVKEHDNDAAAWHNLSQLYFQENKHDAALDAAEKAVAIDSENTFYLKSLAELLWSVPASERLLDIYEQITNKDADDIKTLITYTNALLTTTYYERTIKNLEKLKEHLGVSEDINLKIVKLYEKLNKTDKAYKEMNELIESMPNETRFIAMLAEMYMKNGKEDQAMKCYDKISEINPSDPYIYISKAEYFKKKNDIDNTYKQLAHSFASPNLDGDSKINFLMAFYSTEDILVKQDTNAIKLLAKIIDMHPDNLHAISMMADVYLNDNEPHKAREGYYKVLESDIKTPNLYLSLLSIELFLGNYDSVLNLSNEALNFFPITPELYFYKGSAELFQKKYNEAIESFKSGLNLTVKDDNLKVMFLSSLGDAYNANKNKVKAFESYEKVITIDSTNAYVLNNYSYFISSDKQYNNNTEMLLKAKQMAKKAVEINPESPHYLDTYGWALFKLKKYNEAKKYLEKAEEKAEVTSLTEIYEHLGDCYWKTDNKNKAIEYWNKALQNNKTPSETLKQKVTDNKYYE